MAPSYFTQSTQRHCFRHLVRADWVPKDEMLEAGRFFVVNEALIIRCRQRGHNLF